MDTKSAIQIAVDHVGGPTAMQKALGLKYQSTVSNWLMRGRAPAAHCLAIQQATGSAVTVHDLRPDVFGPRQKPAA